jgi:uncharacterized protein involved in exopolysaccharide biosynthesis
VNAKTTLYTLLHILFRRQKIIVGLSVGLLGTILLGTLLVRPQYEASSSILIRVRSYQQDLLSPGPRHTESWTVFLNLKEEINSEIEIIRSRPVLERVVTALKLEVPREVPDPGFWGAVRQALRAGPRLAKWLLRQVGLLREESPQEAFEAAVVRLGKRLWIEPSTDSQIVQIIYRDPDPVLASQVVNAVAEEYRRQHLAINLNQAEGSFYAAQIMQVESELKTLQDQLVDFKSREGILSFPEQSTALLRKLQTFDVSRTTIQKEIISRRSKVEKIQELRQSHPELLIPLPEIAQDTQIQDLENKLVNLQYQLRTMQQRYTPESRQVITAHKQEEETKAQIREQVSLLLEREIAQLRTMEAEEQALTQTVRELEAEIKAQPAKEVALDNLEKQVAHKQETLAALRKKYQDSVVNQAADTPLENAKIVSLAPVPLKPAAPNLPLNLALGLLLAFVVSLSTAFLVDYWDDSLRMPEDFEQHFGRPVFASIPEL